MQTPTIISAPNATVRVLEGESVTLNWTYTLNAGFLLADIRLVSTGAKVVDKITTGGTVNIYPPYNGRLTADITDTFTFITFLALNRTVDSNTYEFEVRNTANNPDSTTVELIVLCKYNS